MAKISYRIACLLSFIVLISCQDSNKREMEDILCSPNNCWYSYNVNIGGTSDQRICLGNGLRLSFFKEFAVSRQCSDNYDPTTYKAVHWSYNQNVLDFYYCQCYVYKVDKDTIWLVDTLFNIPNVLVNRRFDSVRECYDTVVVQWKELPPPKKVVVIDKSNGILE